MREFETGAKRDDATGKGRYDLMPWGAIHELAKHCERGALHYGERNIDKGIPQHSLIDSACRHLSMYIQGDAEPYHLQAALWNVAWAVEQEAKRAEMIDLPVAISKTETNVQSYRDKVAELWPEQLQYLACNGGENCPDTFFWQSKQNDTCNKCTLFCKSCWSQPYNGEEIIYERH